MSKDDRPLPVPASRLARGLRTGALAARLTAGMLPGAMGALSRGQRPDPRALLLTPGAMRQLTAELSRMRGAAMKLGQLLSMESSDLMPPELAQILSRLRADAHPMPPAQLKRVLQDAYGRDALRRFARFDVRPLAAASIGQVHRAQARDGRDLALKIQYPGIRGAIDADVANLGLLLRRFGVLPPGLDLAPLLEAARRQLHEEADYRREAAALRAVRQHLDGSGRFLVPAPQDDLSTGDILAMDFMEGAPLETLDHAPQERRDDTAAALIALFLHELFGWRHVQTDPNFANYRIRADGRIVLLDFGATRRIGADLAAAFLALMRAVAEGRPEEVRQALYAVGYMRPETPEAQQATVLALAALVRPALTAERFDFGDTRTLEAARRLGERLALEQGFAEVPPVDALLLQRKLAGLVMLATRLRARVPMAALVAPWLNGDPVPRAP